MNKNTLLFLNVLFILLTILTLSGCDTEDPESVVDDSGPCRKFNLNIDAMFPPISYCGAAGTLTVSAMNSMNNFWGSYVEACSVPGLNNGMVMPGDPARIYYDPNLLSGWDSYYASTTPSDIFLAHEYGHNVQLNLFLTNPYRELQADCLAGYYMGFQSCQGTINESDVIATYTNFCNIGDVAGNTAWWNTSTHGTCAQRVSNIQQGFNGYSSGLLPGQACP